MTSTHGSRILIVDDEPNAIRVLSAILADAGYAVAEARDTAGALATINREDIDVVITDFKMPGNDGMHLFEHLNTHHPEIPVIFLTAYGTVDSAVNAITRGAFYYFIKPPDYVKLKGILAKAVEQRNLKRELEFLRKRLNGENRLHFVIGNSPQVQRIVETVKAIKDSPSSVFICGETGTGKELVARMLHEGSVRRNKPFVALNCAAIPRELMESELFGYERGSFTGAASRRIGKFEEAQDGTLFLDEIGEMDLSLQAKILRVLQEKELQRIGSNTRIEVNFRLVCSTNRDLKKEISAGAFRDDLYYRINVVQINVPPLRQRKADIPLLVAEFVKEFCVRENKSLNVADTVMEIFLSYHWPGNVRELRNVIERAVVLARGAIITERELPAELRDLEKELSPTSVFPTLRELELQAIVNAIRHCRGNKSKAALLLGISRKALYSRIKESALL